MEGEDHIGLQSHLRKDKEEKKEEETEKEEAFTVGSYAVFIPLFRRKVLPPSSG
jgi:hypothetical protein